MVGRLRRLWEWGRALLPRVDSKLVFAMAALAISLLGFVEVVDMVSDPGTPSIDERALRAMRADGERDPVGPGWLEQLAIDVSALGSGGVTGVITLAVIGYVLLERKPRMAALIVVCVTGVWALMFALKGVYARERPEMVVAMAEARGMSFPSGHAMVSAALYTTLAVLLARIVRRLRVKLYLVALALALAALVGLTRVYLGVHYPTDVLGGWSVGFGWALACGIVARLLQRRRLIEPAN